MRAPVAVVAAILAAGLASACGGQGGHAEPTTVTVTASPTAQNLAEPGGTWRHIQDEYGQFLSDASSSACTDYECIHNQYTKMQLLKPDVMNMPASQHRTEVLQFVNMFISDFDKNCSSTAPGFCHPEMFRMDVGATWGAIKDAAKDGE